MSDNKRVECPVCGCYFAKSVINEHANKCLTNLDDLHTSSEQKEGTSFEKRIKFGTEQSHVSVTTPTEASADCSLANSSHDKSKKAWSSLFQSSSSRNRPNSQPAERDGVFSAMPSVEDFHASGPLSVSLDSGVPSSNSNKPDEILLASARQKLAATLSSIPLPERMRPTSVVDYVGQGQIVGSQKPLRALIEANRIGSMIFWGPPGCGKVCS